MAIWKALAREWTAGPMLRAAHCVNVVSLRLQDGAFRLIEAARHIRRGEARRRAAAKVCEDAARAEAKARDRAAAGC